MLGLIPVLIVLQPPLIVQILLPAEVGGVGSLPTHGPLCDWTPDNPTVGVASAVAQGIRGAPTIHLSTGIGGVMQDSQDARRTRGLPHDCLRGRAAQGPRWQR